MKPRNLTQAVCIAVVLAPAISYAQPRRTPRNARHAAPQAVTSAPPTPPVRVCAAGTFTLCPCGADEGRRSCAPDGSRWEACECPSRPRADPLPVVVAPTRSESSRYLSVGLLAGYMGTVSDVSADAFRATVGARVGFVSAVPGFYVGLTYLRGFGGATDWPPYAQVARAHHQGGVELGAELGGSVASVRPYLGAGFAMVSRTWTSSLGTGAQTEHEDAWFWFGGGLLAAVRYRFLFASVEVRVQAVFESNTAVSVGGLASVGACVR